MKVIFTILITAAFLHIAQSLSCLQCNNVPQPRHCTTVTECSSDEICGVETLTDGFGEKLYNVGCMKNLKCIQSNNTQHCIECCISNLCNAEGCGQIGYPHSRGPVCFNCPVRTNPKACHLIDVCQLGEVCMFDVRREFGDIVYSSRCVDDHACRQGVNHETALVGRDVDEVIETRSIAEHMCRNCCAMDLCNNACQEITVPGKCDSGPCVHGVCHEENGDYLCVCNQGFGGKQCNVSTSQCLSNPCYNGQCHDTFGDYICVCDEGYTGKQCNTSTDHCVLNPCHYGQCYDGKNDFYCLCDHGYEGKQCDIQTSLCLSNPCVHGQCSTEKNGYSCQCPKGYGGSNCQTVLASDCYDVLNMNISKESGVYVVKLWRSHKVIEVYCDMKTDNGGWTVFQRRFNGSVDFYRNFTEYENGFGNVFGEFWLGLEYIQEMAAKGATELRLDLIAADGSTAYETYQNFTLGVRPGYTLHISSGKGTAGDSTGLSYNKGYNFTTYDRDNNNNCAVQVHGGWWYTHCAFSNLNGEYITPGQLSNNNNGEGGMTYYNFQSFASLKESTVMFRSVHN